MFQAQCHLLFSGQISLLVAPLVSIEQQCGKVCEDWNIPYISLDRSNEQEILSTIEGMARKPIVITTTITRVSQEGVQKILRRLPISVICVDEAQVCNLVRYGCYADHLCTGD